MLFCVLQLFQMKRYKQEELLYVQVMDADVFSSDPLGDACIRCGVTQPRSRFVYELLPETRPSDRVYVECELSVWRAFQMERVTSGRAWRCHCMAWRMAL